MVMGCYRLSKYNLEMVNIGYGIMESRNGFCRRAQPTLIDCALILSSCGLAFCEYALI